MTARGIRTLLFGGANLDQCVALSLQDAFGKGWDCLFPGFARRGVEFNIEEGWGFVLACEGLRKGFEGTEVSETPNLEVA